MPRKLKSVAKFVVVLLAMTIVCTLAWQIVVAGYLYDCTDNNFAGFLTPGGWVHFDYGVVYVSHVVHGRATSEPDSIKTGWSVKGLWYLWLSFVAVSLAVSVWLARKPWHLPEVNVS